MCVLHQAVKPPRGVTPSSRSSKPGVCRERSDHDNQARVLQTARKWPLQPGRRGRSLWARASVCEVLTAEQHSSHQGRRPLAGPAGHPEATPGPRRPDASPPPLTPAEPTRWNAPSFWENFTCIYTRAGFGGQGVGGDRKQPLGWQWVLGRPVQGGAVDKAGRRCRGKMDRVGPFVIIQPAGVDTLTLEAQASDLNCEKASLCV